MLIRAVVGEGKGAPLIVETVTDAVEIVLALTDPPTTDADEILVRAFTLARLAVPPPAA